LKEAMFYLKVVKDSRLEEGEFTYCAGKLHALELNENK